jgi:hypothetical protein
LGVDTIRIISVGNPERTPLQGVRVPISTPDGPRILVLGDAEAKKLVALLSHLIGH